MNTQGIGLGLVISENIVKAFNGRIGVKSKYKKGTKFAFSIILGKEEDFVDNMNDALVLLAPTMNPVAEEEKEPSLKQQESKVKSS